MIKQRVEVSECTPRYDSRTTSYGRKMIFGKIMSEYQALLLLFIKCLSTNAFHLFSSRRDQALYQCVSESLTHSGVMSI
jgi:hypothetical protein